MTVKQILITGSGGFVGKNLIHDLVTGFSVDGLDIPGNLTGNTNSFYTWEDLGKLPDYDVVIHLAGKAHDIKSIADPESYFEVNLGLTKRIFDWFVRSGSGRFIFLSSVKAVADSVDVNILTEDHIPDPKTPYGQSKLAAEQYILDQKLPPGKKVYILRPCMIHGPGNKGNLNLLYNIVKKGLPYPLGAFNNLRSFTSINNLNFIINELIEKDIESGTYQIADDDPISTTELVEIMANSLNKSSRIWKVPEGIIRGVAKTGDWMQLPLNSERLKKLTESYVVSNKKLKSALSVNSMPVSARDGLKHTFESFK